MCSPWTCSNLGPNRPTNPFFIASIPTIQTSRSLVYWFPNQMIFRNEHHSINIMKQPIICRGCLPMKFLFLDGSRIGFALAPRPQLIRMSQRGAAASASAHGLNHHLGQGQNPAQCHQNKIVGMVMEPSWLIIVIHISRFFGIPKGNLRRNSLEMRGKSVEFSATSGS